MDKKKIQMSYYKRWRSSS